MDGREKSCKKETMDKRKKKHGLKKKRNKGK